jgi:hypothetical protein
MQGAQPPADESAVSAGSERAQQGEWTPLFDGRTTNGWRPYRGTTVPAGWQVIDGALVRAGEGAGDIITENQYRNFDLVLEWKVAPGGNSGIFYRGTQAADYIWRTALEMQVLDDERHADGKSPLTSAGSLFALYPAPRGVARPADQWNAARILANGNHVEHWLNGVKLFEFELGSADFVQRVQDSKFRTMPQFGKASEGYIGLQDHGDRVEFRSIRIKVLP